MNTDNMNEHFKKPEVDEEQLMNIISGDKSASQETKPDQNNHTSKTRPQEKLRVSPGKKINYEASFLVNNYQTGNKGKVVYIRPEFHERLLRIVQLTKEERITLYSYIDNILEYHFREFGSDIIEFFNQRNKPLF